MPITYNQAQRPYFENNSPRYWQYMTKNKGLYSLSMVPILLGYQKIIYYTPNW